MIRRSTGPLVVAYLFLVAAGVVFLHTPAASLAAGTDYSALLKIWSSFYIAGGAVAAGSALARSVSRRLVSFWYFEIAGLALLITANTVYAYALLQSGFSDNELNVVAVSLILIAFTWSLTSRAIDAYRYARVLIRINGESIGAGEPGGS